MISPLILSQTNVRPIEEPRVIDLIGSDATTKRQVSYRQWRQWQRSSNAVLQKACSRLIYQCTRLDKIIVRLRVLCALLGISLSRNSRKDESLPHGKYARRYLVFVSLRCRSTGRFCKADTHFTASLILETARRYFIAPLFSNPLRTTPHPAEMQKLVRIPAQSKRAPRNLNIPVNVQLWLFGWRNTGEKSAAVKSTVVERQIVASPNHLRRDACRTTVADLAADRSFFRRETIVKCQNFIAITFSFKNTRAGFTNAVIVYLRTSLNLVRMHVRQVACQPHCATIAPPDRQNPSPRILATPGSIARRSFPICRVYAPVEKRAHRNRKGQNFGRIKFLRSTKRAPCCTMAVVDL